MKKFIFVALILAAVTVNAKKDLIRLNKLLAANTRTEEGGDEEQPLKRPFNIVRGAKAKGTSINIPAIMLDYEKHGASLLQRKDLQMDKACEYRQGYVGVIVGKPIPANDLTGTPEFLKVKPVFAVLNKFTLSLFENEHLSSLYSSLALNQVKDTFQPPEFNVTGIFCFYVVRGPKVSKENTKVKGDIKMKLCFSDALDMEGWKKAIDSYDTCKLVPKAEDEPDETIEVDGSAKVAKRNREAQEEDKIKALHDADEKAEEEQAEEMERQRQELKAMSEKLNGIKQKMEEQRIKDAKDRHRAIEERKRLVSLRDFLRQEEDCLTKEERRKTSLSIENSMKKIEDNSHEEELNLLSGLGDSLNTESSKERLLKEHARIEQLECEREQAEKLKNLMIQTTVAYEHILDSGDCYGSSLAGGSKTKYIQTTCLNLFTISRPADLKGLKDCIEDGNFCNSCCNYVIGESHETQRLACKTKCQKAMAGVGPSVVVPVSRQIKSLDMTNLSAELKKKFTNKQGSKSIVTRRRRRRRR